MLAHVPVGVEVVRSSGVADVDFTKVEQPDELIQLAWNAGLDRKAVIREGTNAASLLIAGDRTQLATLLWPVPRPLEAIRRWSQNSRPVAGASESLRPFASAIIPACIVGYVGTRLLDGGSSMMVAIIAASVAVIGLVLKILIDAAVRRRAARLDEEAALAVVLEQLRRGMTTNTALVPIAVTWLRRGFGGGS